MNSKDRLLLFDIDGTLLDTGGAGAAALLDATEEILEVNRDKIPPLDLAGATDSSVIRKLFKDAGLSYDAQKATAFWESYLRHLQHRMSTTTSSRIHPGIHPLLDALKEDSRFSIGLLTGNIRRGAHIKLQHFDIHHHFIDGAFGDDGELRNELAIIAHQRMQSVTNRNFAPHQIIVIGDTPKDIGCAEVLNARCLAVSTGIFDRYSLEKHSPWLVYEDLSETHTILQHLAS